MNIYRIRQLIAGLGLLVPATTTMVGCGDPCLDDGYGSLGDNCAAVPAEGTDSDPGMQPGDESSESSESGEMVPDAEELFFLDADGDGFGAPADSVMADPMEPPDGYVLADLGDDCDDTNAATHPGSAELDDASACMNDDDDDGWGDIDVVGDVAAGSDCDDESDTTYPGAAANEDPALCTNDDDGDGWGDSDPPPGVDPGDDCADQDPVLFGCDTLWCIDGDGDGFGDPRDCVPGGELPPSRDHVDNDDDCLDDDPNVQPGAAANEPRLCTVDVDGDGWGDADPPPGSDAGTDCSDSNPNAFPGAAANEPKLCTVDADGDGFGDMGASAIDPLVSDGTDCLDDDALVYPGAAANEPGLCTMDGDGDGFGPTVPPEGADMGSDCDDAMIFAFPGASENEQAPLDGECTLDADEDGYGDEGALGEVMAGTDCNDGSANTYPGAAELEPGDLCMADEDLDGYGDYEPPMGVTPGVDCADGDPGVTICGQWCFDADTDGFGDAANCTLADGSPGPEWVPNDIDCLDDEIDIYPGAAANEPGLCTIDGDGDGYGAIDVPPGADAGTDCDDGSLTTFPGAAQGEAPPLDGACTADFDDDGFADATPAPGVTPGNDCEDTLAFAFPGASENELGALASACTLDADGDGFGDGGPPPGVLGGTDCDDAVSTTYPGAAELEDPAACMADADFDGYGDAAPPAGVTSGVDCEDGDPGITICNQWCQDGDGDGFGGQLCQLAGVAPGPDWVENSADCLDTDALAAPGVAELDDPGACMLDADDDGYGDLTPPAGVVPGSDCGDESALVYPGAAANEAGLCTADADGDGYGDDSASTLAAGADNGSDCDDSSAATYPGAAGFEAGLCTSDADGDGYGTDSPPPGVDAGSDCDDTSITTFPGAAPNDDPAACLKDDDGDDYGDIAPPPGVTPGVDCDDTDPGFADCNCLSPLSYLLCDGVAGAPVADAYQAMGVGCSADDAESIVLFASDFSAVVDGGTWAVINQYGTALDPSDPTRGVWSPRPDAGNPDAQHNAGNNLLVLSTGPIAAADASGVVVEAAGSQAGGGATGNPGGAAFPGAITDLVGSAGGAGGTPFLNCDGINDCSDALAPLGLPGLGLNDQVYFTMDLVVPDGVDGFRFDFAYFSGEYPAYVDTQFNDIFIAWVESGAFTGNVAVTADGTPFTITELANSGEMVIEGDDPLLVGTGFEGNGGTGWRSMLAPVIPGETITVSFFLADAADSGFTTAVLIDNFRWDCAGCDGVGDCGLTSLP